MSESARSPAVKRQRRGLGRGLEALLAGSSVALAPPDLAQSDEAGPAAAATSAVTDATLRPSAAPDTREGAENTDGHAPIGQDLIDVDPHRVAPNPEQPRRAFDAEALTALAESIKLHGLLQPIVVERIADRFQLVAGERRLRAAKQAGVTAIPAVVRPNAESARDALEMALTENLLRAELNPLEEAAAYSRLADTFGLSHDAIATRLGRGRPTVSNAIRLLALPTAVQEAIAAGHISVGHGRALLALPRGEQQEALATTIVAEGLSVREVERAVQRLLEPKPMPPMSAASVPPVNHDDHALVRGLEMALGAAVRLERRRRGGRILIEFASEEDLNSLYQRLDGPVL